jgi:general secretion pathway protein K
MTAIMSRRRGEQGIALISVLWVVLLLSIVAASMVAGSRSNGALASATYDRARAEALAEAAVTEAVLALLDTRPEKQRSGRTLDSFPYADAMVTTTTQDETGKIDLNSANEELLRSLFKSVGVADDAADALFDKIADWRDEGDLHRLNGAKADDYREKGYPYGPRNGPFDGVEELKEVMDVTPELFDKVKGALTVYSSRSSIDPSVAQAGALSALSQMITGQPEALAAAQQKSDLPDGVAPPPTGPTPTGPMTGKAFMIHAEIRLKKGAAYVVEAAVRLTANPRQPFWVMRLKEVAAPSP